MTGARKSLDQLIEEAKNDVKEGKARVADLEARKAQLVRSFETRRKVLTGAVVQAYADRNPGFRAVLEKIRLEGIQRQCDRVVFPELFPESVPSDVRSERPRQPVGEPAAAAPRS
jgi:hypothetical protein